MTVDELTPTADVHVLASGYTREQGAYVSRARILELPDLVRIIPGHGQPFSPSGD